MSDSNNAGQNTEYLSKSELGDYVSDTAYAAGKAVLDIPKAVIAHRREFLYQSMSDLDAIYEIAEMLKSSEHDAGFEGIQRPGSLTALGQAISALATRSVSSLGGMAEEYSTLGDIAEKEVTA